jgi:hypothetical protein
MPGSNLLHHPDFDFFNNGGILLKILWFCNKEIIDPSPVTNIGLIRGGFKRKVYV